MTSVSALPTVQVRPPNGRGRSVEVVVGLDIGTTTSKALIRPLGDRAPILVVDAATVWTTTAGGGTEAQSETLLDTAVELLSSAVDVAQARWGHVAVRAISVTGLAESGVLLNPAGRSVHPAMSWFDPRGHRELAEVARVRPEVAATYAMITGLPYSAQASFAKLLLDSQPRRRVRRRFGRHPRRISLAEHSRMDRPCARW